jgi:hypothetical protein
MIRIVRKVSNYLLNAAQPELAVRSIVQPAFHKLLARGAATVTLEYMLRFFVLPV